jgi:peptide/nickel transport system permease protein
MSEAGTQAAIINPPTTPGVSSHRIRRVDVILLFCTVAGAILVGAALLASVLAPFDPDAQRLLARLRPPVGFERADPRHWLGTDQLGRDLLSRCLFGLQLTLALSFFGAVVGLVLGSGLGLLAGYAGGIVDDIVMGIVDVKIAMPFTLVALLVVALAGSTISVLILVLGLAYWAHFARLVRAQVLALRDLPYIEAARAAGASNARILMRHVVPNILSPVIVMFTLNLSHLILLESSLSFLGLGVQPPTASLGSMVGQGRDYMASAPWVVVAPSLLIILVALVVMLLGDWLRDRLDVRLQER